MSTITSKRPEVEWVLVEHIVPNPLNPRKNDAIRTEEMQEIILSRGWEIPLTVYKKGKVYVVLSGHRRLFAAKQTKSLKEIPVFVVDPPENHQEEIERIASLQRGQVDWTPYEWGKFTYERWIAWGKPTYKEFAERSRIAEGSVAEYIQVLQYYPRHEIESGLESKIYNMSTLNALVDFMNKMKIKKTDMVASMTEDMIRKVMLKKIEGKLVIRDSLRLATSELFEVISDTDLLEFFTTSNMSLQDVLDAHAIEKKKRKTFHGRLVSIGMANRTIGDMPIPYQKDEQEKLLNALDILQNTIKKQVKAIKKAQKEQGKVSV